jgi:hypothetical protein
LKYLFLDDDNRRTLIFRRKHRYEDVVCVETAEDAIKQLSNIKDWDEVHLDHDLDREVYVPPTSERTGSEVVRFIVKNKDKISKDIKFIIHTHNHYVVVSNMIQPLRNAGFEAEYIPFGEDANKVRNEVIDAFCNPDIEELNGFKAYIIGEGKEE